MKQGLICVRPYIPVWHVLAPFLLSLARRSPLPSSRRTAWTWQCAVFLFLLISPCAYPFSVSHIVSTQHISRSTRLCTGDSPLSRKVFAGSEPPRRRCRILLLEWGRGTAGINDEDHHSSIP